MIQAQKNYPLESLLTQGTVRRYAKDSFILLEGNPSDALLYLKEGRVRSLGQTPAGKEISYNTIEAGHFFGEMGLDGGERSASVKALEPSECIHIANHLVLAFAHLHSAFAVELLSTVITRARAATHRMRDIALLDVYERLSKALQLMATVQDEYGPDVRVIEPKPTHASLAMNVGASREMVSKLLKDLEKGGYVQTTESHLLLLKKLPANW
jgi:CRP/FNR family transcriptional regulator, cyclic AMP receptor protein